ncbi:hypothetical protein [Gimesia sp.]|uniref:hypothetical protein n=1 Tax=Gimesia sp. TaxID=2024833 RepID=UPI000C55E0A4|nr:hypothetical protein [Gimesia sp.]MAX37968.1 hypothetical protein [Gimesia sp.]HBL44981.1 hypothetical protein [Planctomycetaceae bacterium]|tara:strand:- start:5032 stop:5430 length:399 start_codon:yes stop_codon:yes gene_type:complete
MKYQFLHTNRNPQPIGRSFRWPQTGLLLLCLLNGGCFSSEPALSGVIGGTVVRSGQPVTAGRVELHSSDAVVIVAEIDANGSYSMDSIKAGNYHVAIVSERVPEKFADPQTSGLTIQMEAGTGPLIADFEIP